MGNIKVKFADLFRATGKQIDLKKTNEGLDTLLKYKARSAALKYDIEIKLTKAVYNAISEFEELRTSLCREHSVLKKIINPNGKTEETYYAVEPVKDSNKIPDQVIVRVDGMDLKGVIVPRYDIKDPAEFDKKFIELLNTEVELNCHPIKLSKLEAEEDTSGIDFSALEKFIVNDME